jgi:hypothetical protein
MFGAFFTKGGDIGGAWRLRRWAAARAVAIDAEERTFFDPKSSKVLQTIWKALEIHGQAIASFAKRPQQDQRLSLKTFNLPLNYPPNRIGLT